MRKRSLLSENASFFSELTTNIDIKLRRTVQDSILEYVGGRVYKRRIHTFDPVLLAYDAISVVKCLEPPAGPSTAATAIFSDLHQPFQTNTKTVLQIKPAQSSSTSFPIYYSQIIL